MINHHFLGELNLFQIVLVFVFVFFLTLNLVFFVLWTSIKVYLFRFDLFLFLLVSIFTLIYKIKWEDYFLFLFDSYQDSLAEAFAKWKLD